MDTVIPFFEWMRQLYDISNIFKQGNIVGLREHLSQLTWDEIERNSNVNPCLKADKK